MSLGACVGSVVQWILIEKIYVAKKERVTSYSMFANVCLDREVLNLAIRSRCDIRAEEPDYSSNSYRKAAYRQYCLWKYGKLGSGNRQVLPSCTVLMIRHGYPAPNGVYLGFRASWILHHNSPLSCYCFIYILHARHAITKNFR